ncbi:MAG TPA: PA2169 family four-helix-bundle protein [Flavobacterium sp.]|nr:PA2169 family four-helix-bundle protein [Flavobacterium sp.]
METDKSISLLNQLIEINNDRVEGYKTASEETKDSDLLTLFADLQATSRQNLSELRSEVTRLGGKPEEGTRVTGKFFRAWMDVKSALSTDDRATVLNSCEFGEDKALEAYEDVMENSSNLSSEQINMVRAQKSKLQAEHDRVRSLRDMANA